jgi:hypothetical protein
MAWRRIVNPVPPRCEVERSGATNYSSFPGSCLGTHAERLRLSRRNAGCARDRAIRPTSSSLVVMARDFAPNFRIRGLEPAGQAFPGRSLGTSRRLHRLHESRFHPPPAPPVEGGGLNPSPLAGEGRERGNSTHGRSLKSTTTLMYDRAYEMQCIYSAVRKLR